MVAGARHRLDGRTGAVAPGTAVGSVADLVTVVLTGGDRRRGRGGNGRGRVVSGRWARAIGMVVTVIGLVVTTGGRTARGGVFMGLARGMVGVIHFGLHDGP